ncbi:MAG: hypothetical protein JNM09_19690 [Blastocatellia bacterium]|nr:hypothetical protein [Blastocatellia bacterium]
MALDPKKRQKKLAKRKAQRKEKAKKIVVQQQQQATYEAHRFAIAAHYPIHQCMSNVAIFAGGMGTVILSRRAPNGDIVMGMFLLDTFCLGVKSAIARVLLPYEYDEMVSEVRSNELLQAVEPSYARKLVESAIAYAATLGFKPDPDYHAAKELFGDIDANECADQFTFGKNGKPFYVAGPLDSPLKRQRILSTLEKNCGVGNFEYLAPMEGLDYDAFDDDDNFDDLEFVGGDDEEDDDLNPFVRQRE